VTDYPLVDLHHVVTTLGQSRPWMDLGRVGVIGHSGGGMMTVAAMLEYPDFFRVGAASSGNHDNNIYEMNSSEFYFGDPRTGPAGSASGYASVADRAARLTGALLLIHGESDEDVSLAHTLRLVDALVHADKQFDLLVLPAQNHEYRYPDAAGRHYPRRRIWRHLIEHLLPEPAR
jgi:dipeptidyl aminopeptidase/acylaminoacyl peptidase